MTGRSRTSSARRSATASTAATIAWPSARGTGSPTPPRANRAFLPRAELAAPRLADLLALDDAAFREMFAGSPIKRIGRKRMIRNCLIAAGNSGDEALRPSVEPAPLGPGPGGCRAAEWALSGSAGRAARRCRPPDRIVRAGRQARVDMGDPRLPSGRGIEIGVEHAGRPAELQLQAVPFADLQGRGPKRPTSSAAVRPISSEVRLSGAGAGAGLRGGGLLRRAAQAATNRASAKAKRRRRPRCPHRPPRAMLRLSGRRR